MNKRLLIITQTIDIEDPVLSFFHEWVIEFSKHFQSLIVIALKTGKYNVPPHVKILSLGKERGNSKIKYLFNFLRYIVKNRREYDAVFVHMNQEYILLGGWLWWLFGKDIYMWRNHHAGSFLTDIAAGFCKNVFCTSKFSYTAQYKKTILMPVGVDMSKFKAKSLKLKVKKSILSLGRIAPSKNVHVFVEALGILKKKGSIFSADIYGDASQKDYAYLEKLKSRVQELNLEKEVNFHSGIPNYKTSEIYDSHEIFVNLSSSGMYDKTIFEAMACGTLVLVSNENLRGNIDNRMILEERTGEHVAEKLSAVLKLPALEKKKNIERGIRFAQTQSLEELSKKIIDIICVI